jgi:tetratricopeptide (TPR) repeat protein
MTDALITGLAKVGSTRITSRTSVMRYKGTKKSVRDIGRELNVDALVEGTVTRSGRRVRITAQLIQVSTDMHLWAETYERDLSEVLELQREVATDIASRINALVKPLDQARTVSPEAYGLYLKARYFFYQYTSEGWQQAIGHFNRAIERDPGCAPAYSGLSDAYLVAGAYGAIPTQEALTYGKAAAVKALELDDTLASAHYALATAYAWYDWNWTNAEREFRRGLELDPNDALGRNWYGGYLSLLGRHEEAIDQHEMARGLDPLSLIVNANLARALYWARRYDEAIAQARKTIRWIRTSRWPCSGWKARCATRASSRTWRSGRRFPLRTKRPCSGADLNLRGFKPFSASRTTSRRAAHWLKLRGATRRLARSMKRSPCEACMNGDAPRWPP